MTLTQEYSSRVSSDVIYGLHVVSTSRLTESEELSHEAAVVAYWLGAVHKLDMISLGLQVVPQRKTRLVINGVSWVIEPLRDSKIEVPPFTAERLKRAQRAQLPITQWLIGTTETATALIGVLETGYQRGLLVLVGVWKTEAAHSPGHVGALRQYAPSNANASRHDHWP
jgi:hypothetical protein